MSISEIKKSLYSDTCVDDGYGEYIIYRPDTFYEKCCRVLNQWYQWLPGASYAEYKEPSIDRGTYEQCYPVLIQAKQIPSNERQEFLKREIAQIDPTLKTFFIPRTLYELCFIEKCFKEAYRTGTFCENSISHGIKAPQNKCWHGAHFKDFGNDQDPFVMNFAYRLNKSIARKITPEFDGGLSFGQITSIANEKLTLLHSFHQSSQSNISFELRNFRCKAEGEIIFNLVTEKSSSYCYPIGIATEEMKKLGLNAIALECSSIVRGKLLLYRGAKIANDCPLEYDEQGKVSNVRSLSYGTGFFAGGMLDPGAAAFHYMRKVDNDAFAILVPQEEEPVSPFAIPKTHALCQIFGEGEKWHGRTRAPTIDVDPEVIVSSESKWMGTVGDIPAQFQLAVTPKQFEEKFQYFQKHCVVNLKI